MTMEPLLANFAKRFADLESENDLLKTRLAAETESHATTKSLLSNVMKQINSDPEKNVPGDPLMNAIQNADMKVFAEKSIIFCDQMRAFAGHILQQQEQPDPMPNLSSPVSSKVHYAESEQPQPARDIQLEDAVVSDVKEEQVFHEAEIDAEQEQHDDHREIEKASGSEGVSGWGPEPCDQFDPQNKFTRDGLYRLGRDLQRLLHENSERIELQSMSHLYYRRYRREPTTFPNATFEEVLAALPGQNIHIESTDNGDYLVLRSSHRDRSFSRQDRSFRQDSSRQDRRRSRSRSPRSSRHGSRGRSRSPERFVRKHDEGSRPARSYYRFARSPEGTLVCIYYNSRTCPNKPCSYAHICGNCGKTSHGLRTCPTLQQDNMSQSHS